MPSTILHTGALFNGPATGLTPASGVLVIDVDTNRIKVGNGTTPGGVTMSIAASTPWADVTGKPTTVAGFGITDALSTTGAVTITDTTNSNIHLNPLAGALTVEGGLSVNARATVRELLVWDGAKVNQPNYLTLYNYESATGRVSEYYGIKMIRDYTGNASAPNQSEIGEIAFGWENTGGETIGASLKAKRDDAGAGYNAYVEVGGSLALTVNSSLGIDVVGNITSNGTISGTNLTSAGLPGVIKAFAHVDVSTPITASADYNVASVVSNSTGKYDVTFTTPMPNANYVVSLSVQTNVSSNHYTVLYYNRTTTGFQVQKFLNGALDSGASGNFSFVIYQV